MFWFSSFPRGGGGREEGARQGHSCPGVTNPGAPGSAPPAAGCPGLTRICSHYVEPANNVVTREPGKERLSHALGEVVLPRVGLGECCQGSRSTPSPPSSPGCSLASPSQGPKASCFHLGMKAQKTGSLPEDLTGGCATISRVGF